MKIVKAIILVDTELPVPITGISSELKKILEKLKQVEYVKEAYVVYGRVDYVVHVEAPTYADVVQTATTINRVNNIRSTETLVETLQ